AWRPRSARGEGAPAHGGDAVPQPAARRGRRPAAPGRADGAGGRLLPADPLRRALRGQQQRQPQPGQQQRQQRGGGGPQPRGGGLRVAARSAAEAAAHERSDPGAADHHQGQIRLVVEEGLNQLPYTECTVTTPTGYKYEGVKFEKGNCGVSIMRSGEAMEQGLRDCCRSIRIGKILIQSDEETQRAKVYYAKFPPDIYRRKVLLMYPILSTGNTVIEAVKVLIEHGVQPSVIILLSLFSTPHGAKSIIQEFPEITILTTEVHPVAPTHFGQKYFGTD
uniref:Uracil phosphoribosyltransferase homolog n=1 Tax=Gallus gallus TaxID=9031 RepID=A0A8V0YKU7_CHICK